MKLKQGILIVGVTMLLWGFIDHKDLPYLNNKEDLIQLGIGRIIESDNSIITKIKLREVNEHWIVYEKDESLHDIMMTDMNRIEFYKTPWGSLKIYFKENKAIVEKD